MYSVQGHLLCLSCYNTFEQVQARQQAAHTEQLRHLMALYNNAAAQFDMAAGLPGFTPRMEIPSPPVRHIQQGPVAFNNFNISDSKVGVINTGEVQRIDVAMERIEQGGGADLAAALQEFTQSVIDSNELAVVQKNELLEQVAEVSEQAALPPAERKRGIVKALLEGIKSVATTTSSLANAWVKLQPAVDGAFSAGV